MNRQTPGVFGLTRRALLAGGIQGVAASGAAATRTPNIVLILADDLGSSDLACYGCPDIRTPNIDGIGRRGVRFTQSYSNGPECTPTRTALMTGRYQQRVGGMECALGIGDVGRYDDAEWLQKRGELGLPASEITLPSLLKRHGYDTAIFGKWHLGYPKKFWPYNHGFEDSFGVQGGGCDYFTHGEGEGGFDNALYEREKDVQRKGYVTDLIADAALSWLGRRRDKPFFLYLPFTAPHAPIQDPDGFDPKLGTAPHRQGDRRVFAKMVERLDARVGDVLARLDKMGAAENTIVVFKSDNGGDPNGRNLPLRDRKSSLWEGGIRVPLLIRWPGILPEERTTRQVALSMDVMPTLLAAAGVAPPERKLDGVDLLPVLKGQKEPFPRTVFWRSKRAARVRKAVREDNWKYVIDAGKEELHDLSGDEREQRDLLAAEPERAARLRAKLAEWEREVMAPRLRPFRSEPG